MSSFTTEELAAVLKIAPRTLEGWRAQTPPQGPPFARVGKKIIYPRDSLIDWLADNVTLTEESL
jgi:hypothetical protein